MNDNLKRLRDAVVGRGREVEVDAAGTVVERSESDADDQKGTQRVEDSKRPTKLAERVFGLTA